MNAIFLDIDGTLWDSTHIVADAWNEVLEKKPSKNWLKNILFAS